MSYAIKWKTFIIISFLSPVVSLILLTKKITFWCSEIWVGLQALFSLTEAIGANSENFCRKIWKISDSEKPVSSHSHKTFVTDALDMFVPSKPFRSSSLLYSKLTFLVLNQVYYWGFKNNTHKNYNYIIKTKWNFNQKLFTTERWSTKQSRLGFGIDTAS